MRYSNLFGKTLRQAPAEAETANHQLLVRSGFVDQLMSGVWSLLPLGFRVHQKIGGIIREEMEALGGQEVFLPTLQKKSQWLETGRWDEIDPPLFKFVDRHNRELALGSTHEEVITDLVRRFVHSYADLPLYLFQIQNKFRNELRSTGGLLRVREFMMKDLYSFHTDQADVAAYFEKVKSAYYRIFERCGLPVVASQASGGTIGGVSTLEFQAPSEVGEDEIVYCADCGWAVNKGVAEAAPGSSCPQCKGCSLSAAKSIEVGHIFNLGVEYSEKMGANFTDKDGKEKPIWMGCYGIGLGRVLAAIVEAHHDERGIIWPESVAPYQVHLLVVNSDDSAVRERAEEVYDQLSREKVAVLYDDREGSAGVKLADADLIGIPWRVVVSRRSLDAGGVEVKKRSESDAQVLSLEEILRLVRNTVAPPA